MKKVIALTLMAALICCFITVYAEKPQIESNFTAPDISGLDEDNNRVVIYSGAEEAANFLKQYAGIIKNSDTKRSFTKIIKDLRHAISYALLSCYGGT